MSVDPASVPEELRSLLPLAERWGLGDDTERALAVEQATKAERQALIDAVQAAPETLWTWLVQESKPPYTDEWARLTELTQAYHLARVINDA